MGELKTKKNTASVSDFINNVDNEKRREDAKVLLDMFTKITGEKAAMWGTSIIGFGSYHYKSERSKQEGDWPLTGFSPRKSSLSIYIMPGFDRYKDLMSKLGKYKTGSGCLYINKLDDVDMKVLAELIKQSVAQMKKDYDVK